MRVEHRLKVERRAGDDLQHVGGGGLLLQRFREIIGTRAQLAQQARVLDGDHGLRGEVLTNSICLSVKGAPPDGRYLIAPISSLSFSIGTTMVVRAPPSFASPVSGSSVRMSLM